MKIGATLRYTPLDHAARWFGRFLPKGLYARALIIIIAPVILLQSVVAYVFMERHYQLVTRRLSSAVTADIAALIDIYESYPQDRNASTLARIASERLQLDVDILRNTDLPPPGPKPFFSILDETLSDELRRQIDRPYWVDTVGRSSYVEVRVKLDQNDVMRVLARRSQAYASNSHIFLVWMGGSSFVLLGIAILFLRNQIRPILRLAEAAEALGKGREIEFPTARRARGAPGRPRLPRDEAAHRAQHRAAHDDAQRRQPRPAHDPHALQAVPRLPRSDAGGRGSQARRGRDEPHARRLSRLRPRRSGDAGEQAVRDGSAPAPRGGAVGRRAAGPRDGARHRRRSDDHGAPRCLPPPAVQPRRQCRAAWRPDRDHRQSRNALARPACGRRRAGHSRRQCARRSSSRSCASTRPATRTRAARASALPSPATSPAPHGGDIVLGESPLGGLRATVRLPA